MSTHILFHRLIFISSIRFLLYTDYCRLSFPSFILTIVLYFHDVLRPVMVSLSRCLNLVDLGITNKVTETLLFFHTLGRVTMVNSSVSELNF